MVPRTDMGAVSKRKICPDVERKPEFSVKETNIKIKEKII